MWLKLSGNMRMINGQRRGAAHLFCFPNRIAIASACSYNAFVVNYMQGNDIVRKTLNDQSLIYLQIARMIEDDILQRVYREEEQVPSMNWSARTTPTRSRRPRASTSWSRTAPCTNAEA